MLPDADSPIWFYATIFNGIWTVVFIAVLSLAAAVAVDNTLLLIENALLFVIFASLEVVSTVFYGKD